MMTVYRPGYYKTIVVEFTEELIDIRYSISYRNV